MARDGIHGLLILDKAGGMTSRDAVNRVQTWFPGGTKIGHTGTLDPLATGVLVICLGQATRLAEYVQAMRKTYRSTFLVGARSDTDDADGTVTLITVERPPDEAEVRRALAEFVGEIEQTPPAFSAAKVSGQRAYALARGGDVVELAPRRVVVDQIEVLSYSWPRLDIDVLCGKGTYIRSIARDLGEKLGCGGLVETLRRTRVGPFVAEGAVTLEMDAEEVRKRVRPLAEAVAELPRVDVSDDEADRLRHGQPIPAAGSGEVAIFDMNERLVGVGEMDETGQCLWPKKILMND